MRRFLASASVALLFSSAAYAQAPLRDKAVDACKAELGRGFKQPALIACVEGKMNAGRTAGKVGAKTGEACKFSSTGGKC